MGAAYVPPSAALVGVRRMTRAQHIALGRLLGFPDCCVRQWVDDLATGGGQATRRGSITLRVRTREEAEAMLPAIHALGVTWTLEDWTSDLRVCYVPCDVCAIRHAMSVEVWKHQ